MTQQDKPLEFYKVSHQTVVDALGKQTLIDCLDRMNLIRNFEVRAESAYQQGHIGGFFHSYMGQEAIQTAVLQATGQKNWYITSYRCHALALLLGATPNEIMAELYGKSTGNAKGRGGSMHFISRKTSRRLWHCWRTNSYCYRCSIYCKYQGKKDEIAVCFLGDGAVPKVLFMNRLNMAALMGISLHVCHRKQSLGHGHGIFRAGLLIISILPDYLAKAYGMSCIIDF